MIHAELVRLQACTPDDPCYIAKQWHDEDPDPRIEPEGTCWKVLLTQSKEPIGNGGLLVVDEQDGVAEIYFRLEADWAREGIMVAALRALIELGFAELDLGKIRAWCLGADLETQSVYREAGMELEEVLKESRKVDEEWHDSYLFCALRPDS